LAITALASITQTLRKATTSTNATS
jgi:hypothetical protein